MIGRRWGRALLGLLGAVALLAGCAAGSPDRADASAAGPTGRVTVFAAASLTDTFTALADQLEAAHPGLDVVLSFGGSSGLAQQVVAGAPADVLATASTATMDTATMDTVSGDVAGPPVVFARNRLQVVVPAGNPGQVAGLADLAGPKLRVALCAPQVPCGAAAGTAFARAGVTPAPDTLEQDVRAVLIKVRLGEADAGVVYRTDVLAAGDTVEGIDLPDEDQVAGDYPIAVLTDAPNPVAAQAFVDLVLSDAGRKVLRDVGFEVP